MSTAGTEKPQAEEDEDAVEAAKAAKEEYNRTLQEQETSLQQEHTEKMQVRPAADAHAAQPSMRWQSSCAVSAAGGVCRLEAAQLQKL